MTATATAAGNGTVVVVVVDEWMQRRMRAGHVAAAVQAGDALARRGGSCFTKRLFVCLSVPVPVAMPGAWGLGPVPAGPDAGWRWRMADGGWRMAMAGRGCCLVKPRSK